MVDNSISAIEFERIEDASIDVKNQQVDLVILCIETSFRGSNDANYDLGLQCNLHFLSEYTQQATLTPVQQLNQYPHNRFFLLSNKYGMKLDKIISTERFKTSLVFGLMDSLVSGMLTLALALFA
ncbi:hypothetical protein CCR75_009529 [Bremia lactucae]|uniref:Uncharacterized protein n=1 Tax=Bremia lactucae TaxID=4779 RepID=A0A976FIX9_BRELC|nr:hypothetical protein CCR75_009529 [Bremia lactucae]